MDTREALTAAALDDISVSGVLADFLEELGAPISHEVRRATTKLELLDALYHRVFTAQLLRNNQIHARWAHSNGNIIAEATVNTFEDAFCAITINSPPSALLPLTSVTAGFQFHQEGPAGPEPAFTIEAITYADIAAIELRLGDKGLPIWRNLIKNHEVTIHEPGITWHHNRGAVLNRLSFTAT